MKIALYIARFNYRGTCVCSFDYSVGLLATNRGEPLIIHWPRPNELDDLGDSRGVSLWDARGTGSRDMFERALGKHRVKDYHNWSELKQVLADVDILYILTSGIRSPAQDADPSNFDLDEQLSRLGWPNQLNITDTISPSHMLRVVYHWVYLAPMADKGTAAISPTVASRVAMFPNGKPEDIQVVAHILRDWTDCEPMDLARQRMRNYLGIPPTATVLGRLGGVDSLNIAPVIQAIHRALQVRRDLYVILCTAPINVMQEPTLNSDPRVIFIAPTFEDYKRCALIDACDYMIHASQRGETFGLSVLEFLSRGRPIITFEPRLSELERLTKLKSQDSANSSTPSPSTPHSSIADQLKWIGYHEAARPEMYWADQHLRHLRVLTTCGPELSNMYKPYWDDLSLDHYLLNLKPLQGEVKPVRFHEYSQEQVMAAFDRVFLRPSAENEAPIPRIANFEQSTQETK